MAALRKVVICGVGLIGGSFALALKAAGQAGGAPAPQIVGLDRDAEALRLALTLGVIDRADSDIGAALRDADLVMLAVPVAQMEAVLREMAPHLAAATLISDAGSTKQDVIAAAQRCLGAKAAQFIPGHPIAGAEKSGVAAANAELYRGKRVVLTPLAENRPADIERLSAAWQACGAVVGQLSPLVHDQTFAAVSHLPHLLAYALVHELAGRADSERLFSFAAGGFKDFTRIASSHPEMWRDICVANRAPLIDELDAFLARLLRIRVMLAAADAPALESMFAAARVARDTWLEAMEPPGE